MTTVIYLASTASTTWVVPANWNSASNTIEAIGRGGNGAGGGTGSGAGGGYSKISNLTLTAGATVGISIGCHGSGCYADTFLCNATSNCAGPGGTAVKVAALGGGDGSGSTPGTATTTGAVGTVKYVGGNGYGAVLSAGGGGSAAGLHGAGIDATSTYGTTADNGYGGAGGSGASTCSDGGKGAEWSTSPRYGSGGGGGANGCNGGIYGGGGAGTNFNSAGTSAQGLIVITYTHY